MFKAHLKLNLICALCDKPVDSIEIDHNGYKDTYVFISRCHNQVDACEIPRYVLDHLSFEEFAMSFLNGIAFVNKKTFPQPTKLLKKQNNFDKENLKNEKSSI